MARRIESLFVPGPTGRLEALLEEPENAPPRAAALVCHPHPQHGGTMHNKVVFRVARGLRAAGYVVLRFNYRGVNLSEGTYGQGEGELEDAAAALEVLRTRYPHLPITLAGFSFGARIVLRLGAESGAGAAARLVIAVGFPAAYADRSALHESSPPRVFLHSTRDQYGAPGELSRIVEALAPPGQIYFIDAQDHFFAGALDRLEETVTALANQF